MQAHIRTFLRSLEQERNYGPALEKYSACLAKEPVHRKYHHTHLTFGLLYAWSENFILPLSHDEVVHGKGSMIGKMSGDDWQKAANLRALYGFMFGHPGKKLLFMGGEFGQSSEWYHEASLDWHLLAIDRHAGVRDWVRDLNRFYREEPALHPTEIVIRNSTGRAVELDTLACIHRGLPVQRNVVSELRHCDETEGQHHNDCDPFHAAPPVCARFTRELGV